MILKDSGKRRQWRHSFGIFMNLLMNNKQRHKTHKHLQLNKVTEYPYKSQPPKTEIQSMSSCEDESRGKAQGATVSYSSHILPRGTSGSSAGPVISKDHNHR